MPARRQKLSLELRELWIAAHPGESEDEFDESVRRILWEVWEDGRASGIAWSEQMKSPQDPDAWTHMNPYSK